MVIKTVQDAIPFSFSALSSDSSLGKKPALRMDESEQTPSSSWSYKLKNKGMNYLGIDISKKTFDVAKSKANGYSSFKYDNEIAGFKQLVCLLDKENDCCVMEASGPYYLKLAHYLADNEYKVSLVNPLVIRRFSQMRLLRAKTDKKDAITIAEYANKEEPSLWQPTQEPLEWLRQMHTHISILEKHKTALMNQLEAIEQNPCICDIVKSNLLHSIRWIEEQVRNMEKQMYELIKLTQGDLLKRLVSIKGIGTKTAILLIVITAGFTKFHSAKQVSSFIGICPRIFDSGTSVKGKRKICKMGMSKVRALLYMCTWSAKFHNKACVDLYERLSKKGKPERVIKIAIANKLIKQAFSIATNNTLYNENFSKKNCI